MTAVNTHSNFFAVESYDRLCEFQVEVITFDGESETVYVDAYSPQEAQELAAAMVANADYTMVQGRC